jgi:predicted SPOUT superfamily RNA methylase MTH1
VIHRQSTVLVEKIKSVYKLISVEGDFAEIYRYEQTKDQLLSLFKTKKKALVIVNARIQIGYDLTKIMMHADEDRKKIILKNFPEPEVLALTPEMEFYDIRNDLFYAFTPDDLTQITKEAKQHLLNKIPESGLMDQARKEALEAVLLIEKIVETIGWKLDYTALEIVPGKKPILEQ